MKRFKILKNGNLVMTSSNMETTYKPYKIGELPKDFGCLEYRRNGKWRTGINNWFKYKGLTYVEITK
tara:strand:- start:244 stop:444 length:201 start_codon:yes stop_codon:yes gene_type:complete